MKSEPISRGRNTKISPTITDPNKHKNLIKTEQRPASTPGILSADNSRKQKSKIELPRSLQCELIPECYQSEHPVHSLSKPLTIPNHILQFCQVLCNSIEAVFGVFAFTPAKSSQDSLRKGGNHLEIPFCTASFIKSRIVRYNTKFSSMLDGLSNAATSLVRVTDAMISDRNSYYRSIQRFSARIEATTHEICELKSKLSLVESELRAISPSLRDISKKKSHHSISNVEKPPENAKPKIPDVGKLSSAIDKNKTAQKTKLSRKKTQLSLMLSEAEKRLDNYKLGLSTAKRQVELSCDRSDCNLLMETIYQMEAFCISKYIIWIEKLVSFLDATAEKADELANLYFPEIQDIQNGINTKEQLSNCFDEWIRQMMLQKLRVTTHNIPTCPSFIDILLEDEEIRYSQDRLVKVVIYANSMKYFMPRAGSKHYLYRPGDNLAFSTPHRALQKCIDSLADSPSRDETDFPEFLFTWRANEALSSSPSPLDRAPFFRLSAELRLEIVQPFNSPFTTISKLPREFFNLCTASLLPQDWDSIVTESSNLNNGIRSHSPLLCLFDPCDTLESIVLYLHLRISALNSEVLKIHPGANLFNPDQFNISTKSQKSALTFALGECQITMGESYQKESDTSQLQRSGSIDRNLLIPYCGKTPSDVSRSTSDNLHLSGQTERETLEFEELSNRLRTETKDCQTHIVTTSANSQQNRDVDTQAYNSQTNETLLNCIRSLINSNEELTIKVDALAHKLSNPSYSSSTFQSSQISPGTPRSHQYTPRRRLTTFTNSGDYPVNSRRSSYAKPEPELHQQSESPRPILLGTQRLPAGAAKNISDASPEIWPGIGSHSIPITPLNIQHSSQGTRDNETVIQDPDETHIAHAMLDFPWHTPRQRMGTHLNVYKHSGHYQ